MGSARSPSGASAFVVEITRPAARNVLHETFQALRGIRVQILETKLRIEGDQVVQTLHLAEWDDHGLGHRRVHEVLAVLRRTFETSASVHASTGRRVPGSPTERRNAGADVARSE